MSEPKQQPLSAEPAAATTLVEALSRAQGQMRNAIFDRKNPQFRKGNSDAGAGYASLAAILDVIRQPLADNGLAVTGTMGAWEDGRPYLRMTLHGHGETIDSFYPLPNGYVKSQEFGSALTYARRYSLSALLNISADEDDDANLAQTAGNGKGTVAAEEIVSPAQLATLQDELAEVVAKDKTYLGKVLVGCGITDLKNMPLSHYDYALNEIKTRKKYLARQEAAS